MRSAPGALVEALRRHALVQAMHEAEVEQLAGVFATASELAKELQQRGWLTAFQVQHLASKQTDKLVLGPYVLLDVLGKGGMGQVFKARHRHLQRLTALKVIHAANLDDAYSIARFEQEAQAAALLSHPNIVTIYDAGKDRGQ